MAREAGVGISGDAEVRTPNRGGTVYGNGPYVVSVEYYSSSAGCRIRGAGEIAWAQVGWTSVTMCGVVSAV